MHANKDMRYMNFAFFIAIKSMAKISYSRIYGIFCVSLRQQKRIIMKNMYKTIALAAVIMVALASCGNAGAQSDKNTQKKSKGVTELTADTFQTKVYDLKQEELVFLGDKPAIVDFTATWCGPCQRIAPILDELANEYDGKIVIYKVDIDKNRDLAKEFNVSSIPAVLYIPLDGEPVMTVGSRDKGKFKSEIETILLNK